MDKQELKELIEEIKWAYERGDYDRVLLYAQEIDLRKVTDNRALEAISDAHAAKKEIQEARDILMLAYERTPMGRKIAYKLSELSIQLDDLDSAVVYFEDFCKMAPRDNDRYLLKYKIGKAGGVSPKDLVKVLATYCSKEVDEKWMYELASLYYKTRDREKCLEVCDNIVLWFANGHYVDNAIALKRRLNPETALEDARRENEGLNIIGGDIPVEGFIDTSKLDEFTEADFEQDFLFDDQEDFKLDLLDEALTETGRSLEDIEIGEAMDLATAKENASVFIEPEGRYAIVEETFAVQKEPEALLEDQIEVDGEVYTLPKTTFDDMSHDWTIPAELLKSDEPAKPIEYEEPVFGAHRYVAKEEQQADPDEPVYGAHRVVTIAEREEAERLAREEAERRAEAEAELEKAASNMELETDKVSEEPPVISVPIEEPIIKKPISEMSKATNPVEEAVDSAEKTVNPAFATVTVPGTEIPEQPDVQQQKEEMPEAPTVPEPVAVEQVITEPVAVEQVVSEPVVEKTPVEEAPVEAPAFAEPVREESVNAEPVKPDTIKLKTSISDNPFISVVKEPTFQEGKTELAASNVNNLFDEASKDNTTFVEEVKSENVPEESKPFILSVPPKENKFQDEDAFSETIDAEKVEEVIPPVIPVPETINIQPKTNKYESVKSLFRHDINDNIDGQITLDSMFATYTKSEKKEPEVLEEKTEEKSFVPGFSPVNKRQVQVMPTVPKTIFDNEIRPEEKLYAEQEESYSTRPEIVENTPVEMEKVEDRPFVFVAPVVTPSRDEVKEIQTHYAKVMEMEKEKAKEKEGEGLKITNIADYFSEFSGENKTAEEPQYYDDEVFDEYDEPEVKADPEYNTPEKINDADEEEYEEIFSQEPEAEIPSIMPAVIPLAVAAEPEQELSDFEKAMMAFDAAKAEGKESFDFKAIFEETEQKKISEADLGADFDDFEEELEETAEDEFQEEYSEEEYSDEYSDEDGEEYEDEYYSEDGINNEGEENSKYDEYADEYDEEYTDEYDEEYDDEYDEYEDDQDNEPERYILPDDIREEVYEFLLIDGMEEKITSAIESIIDKKRNGDVTGGNLIVTGDPKSGKTYLTIAIIKAVGKEVGGNSRVAKVKAESLNGKNMTKVFEKIEGSDLLIENIGYLNEPTVEDLVSVMSSGSITSLVAIEGNQLAIESVLNKHPGLAKLFKTKVDIQELNLAQWADLAVEYAEELGYTVDDMALLALHAKIDELNVPTARLGYADIKTIIDKAIENANYKGKHKRGGRKNKGHGKELDESDFDAI